MNPLRLLAGLSRGQRVLLAIAAVITLIVAMPLRLAIGIAGIDASGLTARFASGTIWSGRLDQARLGAFDIGTIRLRLKVLPLLGGRASFAVDREDGVGVLPLSGTADLGLAGRAISHVTGSLGGGSWGDIPVDRVNLDNLSVAFANGQCRSAEGRVQVVLGVSFPGLDLKNGLAGNARCDNGALVLPLAGESGLERLTLRITETGSYSARFTITATDPALAAGLSAAGFSPNSGGYSKSLRGQF